MVQGVFTALGLVLQNHNFLSLLTSIMMISITLVDLLILMMEGHINAAPRCLAPIKFCDCDPLMLLHGSHSDGSSKTVKEKHPSGQPADPAVVLDASESLALFHPVLFDCLEC